MYKVKQFGSGSEPAGCLSKQQLHKVEFQIVVLNAGKLAALTQKETLKVNKKRIISKFFYLHSFKKDHEIVFFVFIQ